MAEWESDHRGFWAGHVERKVSLRLSGGEQLTCDEILESVDIVQTGLVDLEHIPKERMHTAPRVPR